MKVSTHSTDAELIASALQGNENAYTLLMARYRSPIFHFIWKKVNNRDDADDLTLEAFGKAFRYLHTYTPTHRFSTWLFQIARNHCIDHIRKPRLQSLSLNAALNSDTDCDFVVNVRDSNRNPEQRIIQTENHQQVHRNLHNLKEKYRMLIALRYFDALSYEEIATQMNIPLGTVKAGIFFGKEKLREQWN